jgi:hypothetical protein
MMRGKWGGRGGDEDVSNNTPACYADGEWGFANDGVAKVLFLSSDI